MKRIVSVVAVLAFVLSTLVGLNAAAQQGSGSGMGTPGAGMGAMHGDAQGMSMGAFYMTITNNGDAADRLVSVQTDVADNVEIHDVIMDGGVMQMMPQFDGVEIPAGGELVLEPGSYHIMLIGLTESLLAGDEFTATLTFETAGDVEVTVPVMMSAPDADELTAEPVEAGDLTVDGVWARQAPKIDGMASPMASPAAECPMGGGMHAGECPMGTPGAMHGDAQGMSMGAFYMTIINNGDAADRLVSVQTGVADNVEIHDVIMDGGVMQMMPQFDGVEIPAGGELVLEPGSYHVMLIGLTESLLAGDEFPATLTFENAGDVEITVPVFMSEPEANELTAEPVEVGDLVVDGIWARQAPKIDGAATPAS